MKAIDDKERKTDQDALALMVKLETIIPGPDSVKVA